MKYGALTLETKEDAKIGDLIFELNDRHINYKVDYFDDYIELTIMHCSETFMRCLINKYELDAKIIRGRYQWEETA